MNCRIYKSALILTSLVLFFSSCGSEEGSDSTFRPLTPPGVNADQYNFNTTPSVSLASKDIYAGNDVSFELKFPDGYDSRCNESTPVLWRSVGDASKFTIENTNFCHPKITTTSDYSGEGTIEGNMLLPDLGLVRWTGLLKRMTSASITSSFVPVDSNVWGAAVAGNELVGTDSSWFQKVLATATTPDSYYLRISENNELNCLYLSEFALSPASRAANRSFVIKRVFSKIQSVISNDDSMSFDFECKATSANQDYWGACPFDISRENDDVKFSFKTINDQTCGSSNNPDRNKGPRIVNTFKSNVNIPSNFIYPVEIRLIVKHDRLREGTEPSFLLTRFPLRIRNL